MPDYVVYRAVVPPSFDFDEYSKRSGEPIRWDVVTIVEADTPRSAIEAVISATGIVAAGLAAHEVETYSYGSSGRVNRGGKLQANSPQKTLQESAEAKIERLEREIDDIHRLGEN